MALCASEEYLAAPFAIDGPEALAAARNPELVALTEVPDVEILSAIPADPDFAANDIRGRSVLELPEDSAVLQGVREALRKIEIL